MSEREQIDFKSLSKKDRRRARQQFMKEYAKKLRKLGLAHDRVQVRTLVDRAVALNKFVVG